MLDCFVVVFSELAVDWIKHAFITKFNELPIEIYKEYTYSLAYDIAQTHQRHVSGSSGSICFSICAQRLPSQIVCTNSCANELLQGPFRKLVPPIARRLRTCALEYFSRDDLEFQKKPLRVAECHFFPFSNDIGRGSQSSNWKTTLQYCRAQEKRKKHKILTFALFGSLTELTEFSFICSRKNLSKSVFI